LGETILRAYLIRRSHLIDGGAGMRIVGSCYAPDTLRCPKRSGGRGLVRRGPPA